MSYSLEAWTLPGSTPHEEVVKEVLWQGASFGQRLNGGDVSCYVEVSADYERLDDICDPDSNTETLIRCYRDGTYLTSWFARQRQRPHTHAEQITVSGPGIDTALDQAIVFPYDTPDPIPSGRWQSDQPDWVYGAGQQLLANPSFEDANGSTSWETGDLEGWELTEDEGDTFAAHPDSGAYANNARTGIVSLNLLTPHSRAGFRKRFSCTPDAQYTISVWVKAFTAGRRFTARMSVDPGATVLHTNGWIFNGWAYAEQSNDPRGTGVSDATYQQIVLDVVVGPEQSSFEVILQDDEQPVSTFGDDWFIDDFTIDGPGLGIPPWDIMEAVGTQDATHVLEGDVALMVTTDGTQAADQAAVVQRITDGKPGVRYSLIFWVYHEEASARSFRSIIKRTNGTEGGNVLTSVPPNTWTAVAVTALMNTTTISFLLRLVGTFAMDFWVDMTHAYEGDLPATPGKIMAELQEHGYLRDSLPWLKHDTYTDDDDSAGDPWLDEVSVRVNRGRTLRQAADLLLPWMEWYIGFDGSDYQLMLFNRNHAGTDRRALDSPRLGTGHGYRAGDITRRSPAINSALVEGAEQWFQVATNTTLETAYQRREGYRGQREWSGDLLPVGRSVVEDSRRNTFDTRPVYVDDGSADALPVWVVPALGDQVNVQQPPDLPAHEGRVVALTTVLSNGESEPTVQHTIELTPLTTSGIA